MSSNTEPIRGGRPFESDHLNYAWEQYSGDSSDNSRKTWMDKRRQFRSFDQWLRERDLQATDVDDDDLIAYLNYLELRGGENGNGLAASTIQKHWNAVNIVFKYLEHGGRIDSNPTNAVRDIREPDVLSADVQKKRESDENERINPLTQEEVQALVENVPAPRVRNELIVRLLYQTGIRSHELVGIKFEHCDFQERQIKVVDDKTDGSRWVAYQPSLSSLMAEWVDGGHRDVYDVASDSEYLFPSERSEKMHPTTPNGIVRQAAKNAGIQETRYVDGSENKRHRITAHQLRHTFATHALDPDIGGGSMGLQHVKDILGHSDIEMTQHYLEYIDKQQVRELKNKGHSLSQVE